MESSPQELIYIFMGTGDRVGGCFNTTIWNTKQRNLTDDKNNEKYLLEVDILTKSNNTYENQNSAIKRIKKTWKENCWEVSNGSLDYPTKREKKMILIEYKPRLNRQEERSEKEWNHESNQTLSLVWNNLVQR